MSKDTPDAPDYKAAAQEQAQSSREVTEQQTWANRPTINTPFGQQTWDVTPTWDPATGQYINSWAQNTNLTPESQAALDSQMRIQQGRSGLAESMLGRAQDEYGQPMDWSKFTKLADTPEANKYGEGLPNMPQANDLDPSQRYSDDAENAIYGKFSSRMEPQFQQDSERLRTQLYNSGLKEGDEAYDREMQKLRQSQGDQRQQAQYQATIGAGAEASRMFGMDATAGAQEFQQGMAARGQAGQEQLAFGQNRFAEGMQQAGYQNTARQQQISEEMQRRGFSLNEINAVLNGQQVGMPSMPGFNSAQRSEGVQNLQAAQMQGQHDLDAFNAQQQATQGMMSGIAGGAMMFSDRRLKTRVKAEFKYKGVQVYSYEYLDGAKDIGVMADEVPQFAHAHPTGYMMVDYGQLLNS